MGRAIVTGRWGSARGFTLLELMVVMAIILVLATVGIVHASAGA